MVPEPRQQQHESTEIERCIGSPHLVRQSSGVPCRGQRTIRNQNHKGKLRIEGQEHGANCTLHQSRPYESPYNRRRCVLGVTVGPCRHTERIF